MTDKYLDSVLPEFRALVRGMLTSHLVHLIAHPSELRETSEGDYDANNMSTWVPGSVYAARTGALVQVVMDELDRRTPIPTIR